MYLTSGLSLDPNTVVVIYSQGKARKLWIHLEWQTAHLQVDLQLLHALNCHIPCLAATKVNLLGQGRELEAREGHLQGLMEGMEFTVPGIKERKIERCLVKLWRLTESTAQLWVCRHYQDCMNQSMQPNGSFC